MPYRDNAREVTTLDWSRLPYRVDFQDIDISTMSHPGSAPRLTRFIRHYRWYWVAWLAAWWFTSGRPLGSASIKVWKP